MTYDEALAAIKDECGPFTVGAGGRIRDADYRCPLCALAHARGLADFYAAYWRVVDNLALSGAVADRIADAADLSSPDRADILRACGLEPSP